MLGINLSRLQLAAAVVLGGVSAASSATGPWAFLGAFAVYFAVFATVANVYNGLTGSSDDVEPEPEPDVAE